MKTALMLALAMSTGAPPDFLGPWRIENSRPAPWAQLDAATVTPDLKRLTGRTIGFSPRAIAGPPPLGCRRPHYELKQYAPDMLFQGSLTDPVRQARSLGFVRPGVKTLETGCEGAIDFHFLDARTAMFALNNRLYRVVRHGH